MQKLSKPFVELGTKWKRNNKKGSKFDEFFVARVRLTFYYSLTAIIILSGLSIILYNTILANFDQSISENISNPIIAQIIKDRAQDILLNRFLTIDIVLVFFIVLLGFLLTYKILEPIKSNMQKQKRFIADASHELRTPIAVIISGLEVNLNNKNLDLSGAKKTLQESLEEMREFSKLSNSLLDISKYETKAQTDYEIVSIGELVKSIVEKNKKIADEKEIAIETNMESRVNIEGNKIELGRVFYNILDNAIKYTPRNGKIFISDKIVANRCVITISDTGSGIAKDILDKIFDPFFRGDSARTTDGAGLGLTLSKKIIENHGGTIFVKSQLNKGSSVIVSLPITSS